MTKTLSTDFLRVAIEANGWGDIPEPQPYSAEPIDPDMHSPGSKLAIDPDNLTDEQEGLILDCFKLVAACLTHDDDGTYAALLEAMMGGAE